MHARQTAKLRPRLQRNLVSPGPLADAEYMRGRLDRASALFTEVAELSKRDNVPRAELMARIMRGLLPGRPRSHRWDDERAPVERESVPADVPAGSVLLWDGALYHGGGANHSREDVCPMARTVGRLPWNRSAVTAK